MKNKLQLLLIIFLLNFTSSFSQCGCDVINCVTQLPNVTLFNIYYGDNVTLNAPPLPALHWGTAGYAWFTIDTKTTDDPNQTSQYWTPFINGQVTTSYTFNPLERLNSNPTEGYFMCRTNSRSCSACTATCFYGRSFKVIFNPVPAPILTVNQNLTICSGQSVTLSATNSVGSLIWRENSMTGNIVGTGNSITVSPTVTKTYIVYANNGSSGASPTSITNSQTVSVTVSVVTPPSTPIITQTGNTLYSNSIIGNQWYNQNGIINGATNQNYTPTESGNYYVVNTINGCSSGSSNTINYIFLSLQDFENNKFTIYPNPTNDLITIDCGNIVNPSGWTVKIVNLIGQESFKGIINSQQYVLPINSLGSKGVYFVKIYDNSDNLISTKKIILK